MRLEDALGRIVALDAPARRVVSLVPSETESVVALAGVDRLVGRTEWCEEPAGTIEQVPTVGGTKDVDVDAVLALTPDLVLANQEENTRAAVERLAAAGVPVHVSFPCTVVESLAYVDRLAELLGVPPPRLEAPPRRHPRVRVFAPVWRDPWMTFDGRTYASDLLAWLGADNVFAERPRRYPLAADLGAAPARDPGERDTRYPRATVEEIGARRPERILLPDEPFRFDESHLAEVRGWGLAARVELVSGKDLFWYGVRTLAAMRRLSEQLEQE
ncbi:MAG: ABC transporter substrate-binding protein [Sandaracinaceae bacterium]|nr:ABC transporter substrate-binding protein [Sandaracinaceae bacterium]